MCFKNVLRKMIFKYHEFLTGNGSNCAILGKLSCLNCGRGPLNTLSSGVAQPVIQPIQETRNRAVTL
jgi:hypothetical protein